MSRTNVIDQIADVILTPATTGVKTVFKYTPDGITSGHLPALFVCLEPSQQNGFSIKAQQLVRDDYTIGVYLLISSLQESNRSLVEGNAATWADIINPLLAKKLNLNFTCALIGDGQNISSDQLIVFTWAGMEFRAVQFLIRVTELISMQTGT